MDSGNILEAEPVELTDKIECEGKGQIQDDLSNQVDHGVIK